MIHMAQDIDRDKFWKLYEKLPVDLQGLIFDDEVGERVNLVCSHNGIANDENLILDKIGDVLLGILPPNNLIAEIGKEAISAPEALKKAVNNLYSLFSPVRESLIGIYGAQAAATIPLAPAATATTTAAPGRPTAAAQPQPTTAPTLVRRPPTAQPVATRPVAAKPVVPAATAIRPKPMPIPATGITKTGRAPLPRAAQPKPAVSPQTELQDGPTLSAAPGGLRRKVF